MATRPAVRNLNADSVKILNTIRSNASEAYQNAVPQATDVVSLRTIGNVILQYQPIQNEFLSALVNRIGMVILTSKLYDNPWAVFKRGILEYGETIEEIFVTLAKPFEFDQAKSEDEVFKRQIPDVRSAFHYLNYRKFYKTTISNDMLRTAFLSYDGITQLISGIIQQLVTSVNYDEFLTMKYLLAKHILQGDIASAAIGTYATNPKGSVTSIKSISNLMEFMSPNYNMAGVRNYARKSDQYLIMSAAFNATVDVEVLASAFNMDKAEFMGRQILVDSFANLDNERLAELMAEQPGYTPISAADMAKLEDIPAVLVDKDFWMVFDNYQNMTQQYNGQGLYWNYWYHVWKTFSVSPFANAVMFVPTAGSVTAITLSPATATGSKGQSIVFTPTVTVDGFASKAVEWSVNSNLSTINDGTLTIGQNETATSLTVTCKSLATPTVSATATVTVSAT